MKVSYVLCDEKYSKSAKEFIGSIEARLVGEFNVKIYSFNNAIDQLNLFEKLTTDDEVHLVGDDSIVNKFINIIGLNINYKLYYNNFGMESDFLMDNLSVENRKEVLMNNFFYNLPRLIVDDKTFYFINGVSSGIDANCYLSLYKKEGKYTVTKFKFFIQSLKEIFKFKQVKSTVVVNDTKFKYQNTYFASVLKGRFNCAGMKLAPSQDRFDEEQSLSVVTLSNCHKFKALDIFLLVLKGAHIGNGKQVFITTGQEISVSFDRKLPLVVDGLFIGEVDNYKVIVG